MNPMVFMTAMLFAIYDLYAAIVLAFGLPRLRFDALPQWLSLGARIGIPVVILINWGWLIYTKV